VEAAGVDPVMQVQVQPAATDAVAGELAGIGRQGGQLHLLERGGDVQAVQRIERRQAPLDAHRGVAVDPAGDVHGRRLPALVVQRADVAVELLDGGGEIRPQAEVGEVGRTVAQLDAVDVDGQWRRGV